MVSRFARVGRRGDFRLLGNLPTKSPNVSDSIRSSLSQAGFNDVSISQDRDKGVITLSGHVAAEADKAQAESITRSFRGSAGGGGPNCGSSSRHRKRCAKAVNSDLDKVESRKTWTWPLIQNQMHDSVKFIRSLTASLR